ncbi:glycosyltransferase [Vibrio chagasii]|uniref:glycosyltransferase n=1 Tax=Vibrio chagasii TaxID=170679 RepID=UPI00163EDC3A|nr:glycosyltransferase [Vibrio chagasii]
MISTLIFSLFVVFVYRFIEEKKWLVNLNKKISNKNVVNRFIFAVFYKRMRVKDNTILLESHQGKLLGDNSYYLAKYFIRERKDVKSYFVYDPDSVSLETLIANGFSKKTLVKFESIKYLYLLATSKYLVNDVVFRNYFIKKDNQIYLNMWHGTPVKKMGKNVASSPIYLFNSQRNFIQADILLASDDIQKRMFSKDYMVGEEKVVMGGYPRTDAYFDNHTSSSEKKSVCYLPTWRDFTSELDKDAYLSKLSNIISNINGNIPNDYELVVKLHPLENDYFEDNDIEGVRFLDNHENINEYLNNQVDVLITDYSSVIFDYAIKSKNIILYTHDFEEYSELRGVDLDLFESLPFKRIESEEKLSEVLNNLDMLSDSISEEDYFEFNSKFNHYNTGDSCKRTADLLFSYQPIEGSIVRDALIFSGQLLNNGITTSLNNLLFNKEFDRDRVFVNFIGSKVKVENYNNLSEISEKVSYLPMMGKMVLTPMEFITYSIIQNLNVTNDILTRYLDGIYNREIKRLYGKLEFKNVIHFTGYDKKPAALYSRMLGHKTIFVHNDMKRELKTRGNFSAKDVFHAWNTFDNIAVVRESLYPVVKEFVLSNPDKIKVVHNTVNLNICNEKICDNIDREIREARVIDSLTCSETKRVVTIGRLSPEKGHLRLIKAFEKVASDNTNISLYIVGGHGSCEDEIRERILSSEFSDRIFLITTITNPYPLLSKMDMFLLSSYYEGLPMVFFEAILSGVPVVSTDIPGPKEFLHKGYGKTVDNSVNGLVKAMDMLIEGDVDSSCIDLSPFNDKALKEFDEIFKV